MGKDLNRYLSKEDTQMFIKEREKMLNVIVIREMLIKTTLNDYFLNKDGHIFLKWDITNTDKEVEKLEPSYIAVRK